MSEHLWLIKSGAETFLAELWKQPFRVDWGHEVLPRYQGQQRVGEYQYEEEQRLRSWEGELAGEPQSLYVSYRSSNIKIASAKQLLTTINLLRSPNSSVVEVLSHCELEAKVLEYFLGPVSVVLGQLWNGLLLHASAFWFQSHLVLLGGNSGQGKSTLARLAETAGHQRYADDIVALMSQNKVWSLTSLWPQLKLPGWFPETRSGRPCVWLELGPPLGPDAQLEVTPLKQGELLFSVLEQSIGLKAFSQRFQEHVLVTWRNTLRELKGFRIRVPHNSQWPKELDKVLAEATAP